MRFTDLGRPLMAGVATILALGLAACDSEETNDNTCTTTEDCTLENEVCHPYLKQCVTSTCESSADCGGATPVCNTGADAPISDAAFDGLCVCSATSCAEGDSCNTAGGVCEAGGSSGCTDDSGCAEGEMCNVGTGTCFMACSEVGAMGGACTATEVCLADGTCATPCENSECLTSEQLCLYDEADADYNNCADPDAVTGSCANASSHSRGSGGPIIISIGSGNDIGDCGDGGASDIIQYTLEVWSDTGFPSSFYTEGIMRLMMDGTEGLTYSDGPGTASHPSATDKGNDMWEVEFTLCLGNASMPSQAVFVTDSSGADSNAFCF